MSLSSINAKNGVINLRDGSFTKINDPKYMPHMNFKWRGINYPTEYIDNYVLDLMSNNIKSTKFLQKLIGSLFVKVDQKVIFYGKGHDGKELLAGLIDILLYDYEETMRKKLSVTDDRPPIDGSIVVPFNNRYISQEREVFQEYNDKIKNPYILNELLDRIDELLVWVVKGCIRYHTEGLADIPPNFINDIHNQKVSLNISDKFIYDKIYHIDGERVVVPHSVFNNRINNDLGRLFENFDWDNTILAGEYVLGCLDKIVLYKEYVNTPIDLYVYHTDRAKLQQKISQVLLFFKIRLNDVTYQVFKDTYLISVKSSNFHREINIIGVLYDNAKNLLYNMPLTCHQVGYDGKKLIYTDYFVDTIRSRTVVPMTEIIDIVDIKKVTDLGFAIRKNDKSVNANLLYKFYSDRKIYDIRYASGFTKVNIESFYSDIIDSVYIFTTYDVLNLQNLHLEDINSKFIDNKKRIRDMKEEHGNYVIEYDDYYNLMQYLTFEADIKELSLKLRH